MECIKCGKPIADGELFCVLCSLNPEGIDLDEPAKPRYPEPEGRMQQPKAAPKKVPVKAAAPAKAAPKPKAGRGLKISFTAVCLMFLLAAGYALWLHSDVQVEKNRLRVREADLDTMEWDLAELQYEVSRLEMELDTAQQTIAAKELALQEVETALNGSQSTMSQTQYDLAAQKLELERIKSEKTTLEAQLLSAQARVASLERRVEEMKPYQTKADFMDDHVVFVEDDRTGYYHTYDCANFAKEKFWAYSRKLAEANSYKPCPVCGGRP